MMSKMLASTVTAAIAAARPGLLESRGYAANSGAEPSATRPVARRMQLVTAPRVRLDITLPLLRAEPAEPKLQNVLHCGLGAYIADIRVTSRQIEVEFNLAREDIDFAFHTLISKLSEAVIGPVRIR